MNTKLKKGIAAVSSVFAIGAVGAQMLEAEGTNEQPPYAAEQIAAAEMNYVTQAPDGQLAIEAPGAESVPQPEEAPIVTVDTTTTESLATSESMATSEPIVVAQAEQPGFTQRSTVTQESYRTVVPGLPLPPAASPRSGEDSGEEIATRSAPVDVRAQLSPDYLTDQSPGL